MIALLALLLAAPSPLEGTWQTECMPIGLGGRHGFITTLHVAGKALTARAQLYAHATCDTATLHLEYHGTLVKTEAANGAVAFDHVLDSVTMTADAPDVVAIYNAGKPGSGCGMGGGWVLGVARGVEGRTCAPWTFPVAGTTLYERAWIDSGTLKLGSFPSVWNNITPEQRPAMPGGVVFTRLRPLG